MKPKHIRYFMPSILFIISVVGCNKLVNVPEPISSVTSAQTFSSDENATIAMLGIYSTMTRNQTFSSLETTFYPGESADELKDATIGSESQDNFLSNSLTVLNSNSIVSGSFWQPAYYDIYQANAIIAGVQGSTGMTGTRKSQLIGEAKFIRAFCYFYLTNLFGDLPLDLSIDFNRTVLLAKTPQAQVYQQIVSDLLDAQNSLPADFSLSGGMPIRANKWAATALLARVYLYLAQPNSKSNYLSADSAATAVINSGQFSLVSLPLISSDGFPAMPSSDSDVFVANSREAILQLQTPNANPFATGEGNFFNVPAPGWAPACWLTPQLLAAFEPNDLRRINWVDSSNCFGNGCDINTPFFYYPYKYKWFANSGNPSPENYTLLRLAEQYLIRAETEANGAGGGISAAIADLDTIRTRAGLPNYSGSTDLDSVLTAIQHENRIEFFAEWGHRWFDLKRWGIAVQALNTIPYKQGNISSTQLLYPIPLTEIQTDPNLTQNPGYPEQ